MNSDFSRSNSIAQSNRNQLDSMTKDVYDKNSSLVAIYAAKMGTQVANPMTKILGSSLSLIGIGIGVYYTVKDTV